MNPFQKKKATTTLLGGRRLLQAGKSSFLSRKGLLKAFEELLALCDHLFQETCLGCNIGRGYGHAFHLENEEASKNEYETRKK
jgi:hypothetical protein